LKIQKRGSDGGTGAERQQNYEQTAAIGEHGTANDPPKHAAIDGAPIRHGNALENAKDAALKVVRYKNHGRTLDRLFFPSVCKQVSSEKSQT
jgi:hypothetical protein